MTGRFYRTESFRNALRGVEILDASIYGNTALNWGVAFGVSGLLVALAFLAKPILIRQLGDRASRTHTQMDDALVAALKATQPLLITALAVALGANGLRLPPGGERVIHVAATIALFVQVGLWGSALLNFWLASSRSKAMANNIAAATTLSALGLLAQVVLWAVILLMVLDNLGVNVTTLIAGLGIGGIAVALAVQNILGDLLASLSIVIDKPFVLGDF